MAATPEPSSRNTATPAAVTDRDLRGLLRVGSRCVDLGALRLADDAHARLTRKAASVLVVLARHPGRTLTRSELLDAVWTGTCPTPEVVTQAVIELRRVLGHVDPHAPMIETVPRLGYRLVAPVAFEAVPMPLTAASVNEPAYEGPMEPFDAIAAVEPATQGAVPAARASMRRLHRLAIAGATVVVLLVIAALAWSRWQRPDSPATHGETASATGPQFSPPELLTAAAGAEFFPRLRPGGGSVAYSAPDPRAGDRFKIFEQSIAGTAAARVTDEPEGEELVPVWSPDGARMAFVRLQDGDCEVRLIEVPGGVGRKAFDCSSTLLPYLDWSPDGTRLLTSDSESDAPQSVRLMEYEVDSGRVTWLTYPRDALSVDVEARYAPDGQSIAFRRGARPSSSLLLFDRLQGRVSTILAPGNDIRGYDWFGDGGQLLVSLADTQEPRLVLVGRDGSQRATEVNDAVFPQVEGDAVVFTRTLQRIGVVTLSLRDASAPRGFHAVSTGRDGYPAYSPDGSRLAFSSDRAARRRVWVLQRGSDAPTPMQLEFSGTISSLVWSADGTRLAFVAQDGSGGSLYLADVASARGARVDTGNARPHTVAFDLTRDAVWFTAESRGRSHLHRLDRPGTPQAKLTVTDIVASEVQSRAGTDGIFVLDTCINRLDGALAVRQRYCAPAQHTLWRVGNESIYTLRHTGLRTAEIYRHDLVGGDLQRLGNYALWAASRAFDVAPDESEILYAGFTADDSDVAITRVVRQAP